jgi:hypothetical protein
VKQANIIRGENKMDINKLNNDAKIFYKDFIEYCELFGKIKRFSYFEDGEAFAVIGFKVIAYSDYTTHLNFFKKILNK